VSRADRHPHHIMAIPQWGKKNSDVPTAKSLDFSKPSFRVILSKGAKKPSYSYLNSKTWSQTKLMNKYLISKPVTSY